MNRPLDWPTFFDRDAATVARELLGKVLRHKVRGLYLAAQVIETEAYYTREKGSHASLGYTHARRALFAPAGTVYMYYARGGDSLNFSCAGEGNAVLIKSAIAYFDRISPEHQCLPLMQTLNPLGDRPRPVQRLCSGQTLLCKALNIKVPDWNNRPPDQQRLRIEDAGIKVKKAIQCRRLGIPVGRDEHLLLRFVDAAHVTRATQNPLSKRHWREGREFQWIGSLDKYYKHF